MNNRKIKHLCCFTLKAANNWMNNWHICTHEDSYILQTYLRMDLKQNKWAQMIHLDLEYELRTKSITWNASNLTYIPCTHVQCTIVHSYINILVGILQAEKPVIWLFNTLGVYIHREQVQKAIANKLQLWWRVCRTWVRVTERRTLHMVRYIAQVTALLHKQCMNTLVQDVYIYYPWIHYIVCWQLGQMFLSKRLTKSGQMNVLHANSRSPRLTLNVTRQEMSSNVAPSKAQSAYLHTYCKAPCWVHIKRLSMCPW